MNEVDVNWEEKNQFPVYNCGQLPCYYRDINQNPNIDCAVPRAVPGLHLIPIHLIQPYWLLLILFWEPNSNSRSHSHVSLRATLPLRPGYHGCGSIKGNRENFPKRKEKKRKRRDFLAYWTLSVCKKFRKSPQNILIVIPLFHHTSEVKNKNMWIFFSIVSPQKKFTRIRRVSAILAFTLLWTTWTTDICALSLLILPLHPSFSHFQHFLAAWFRPKSCVDFVFFWMVSSFYVCHELLAVTKSDRALCDLSHVMLVYWIAVLDKGVAECGKETNTRFFFFRGLLDTPPPSTFLIEYVFPRLMSFFFF